MALRLVLLLFLVSGAVGLGYQVLWSRLLLQFIGVSAYSYATVLASFMAGLALGSALLGRLADRVRNPLRLFALLEAGIGGYALVYPALSEAASGLYASLAGVTAGQAGGTHGLWAKALVSGLLLLGPTTLMGGTYPALLRHVAVRAELVGRRAAQLYSVNTIGAVGGALLMAFVVMPGLGLRTSLVVLALVNGLVALVALLLARRAPEVLPSPDGPVRGEDAPVPEPGLAPAAVRLALALIFVEGTLAFALEVGWTRYFAVVLGSSTYSFALVLAVFLLGIALGSAWLSRETRAISHPLRFFGWTQVLAGVAVLAPLALYPHLPWVLVNLGALFSDHPAAFFVYTAGQLLVCATLMIPPTLLIGMAVPLLVRGLARDMARLGSEAGAVYAWNTWGNVLGALLAGLILLPALGMEMLIRGVALGFSGLGLVALGVFVPRDRRTWARLGSAAAVLVIVALAAGPWRTEAFALRPTRRAQTPLSWQGAESRLSAYRTLLFVDDPAALLMVYDKESAGQEGLILSVNGKPDATSYEDLPTQLLLGHVPLFVAPEPRDVLVIGLASGVTAGAVLSHPIRRLDVVDIVSAMPRATRLFNRWNRDPLADPRLRLIVDDARSYLSHTGEAYDVIISEPSNPWMAGTGALFSREFYRVASSALRPDGVFLQWLQAYELTDETFAAVVRTFRGAFPHVYGFQGNNDDVLLLGSLHPLSADPSALDRRFSVPAVRQDLDRIGVRSPAALLAFQQLSPISVDFVAAQTPLENTDDNLLLEYRAPRELFGRASVSLVSRLDERLAGGSGLLLGGLLRRRPGSAGPGTLLEALSDPRIRSEPLHETLRLATHELEPEAKELFPLFAPERPHPFAARVTDFVRSGRDRRAWQLLSSRVGAVLLESALSPERSRFWEAASREWLQTPIPPPLPELRRARIEILLAMGRLDEAARELDAWMAEMPGPEPTWLVLRACGISAGGLCDRALADAVARARSPVLSRLQELRAASP